ncbi:integrase arm-type DNA-binding domain-containing protein [Bradyrhizobium sp.]|uniref:integrase arm-type DNA-binding domain-containing protein n=1 Tax=Bradyrhizobium sp. TaxID=376 RepID=UPI0039E69D6F
MRKLGTAKEVEKIKAAGRHSGGGGLCLLIGANGGRSWVFRYRRPGGGGNDLGLGSADKEGVSLADARERADELRAQLRKGTDPAAERKAGATVRTTFGEFADDFLESIKPGFKGRTTHADWKRDIEVRAAKLRPKQLPDITTNDVLAVLSPIWLTIPRTARGATLPQHLAGVYWAKLDTYRSVLRNFVPRGFLVYRVARKSSHPTAIMELRPDEQGVPRYQDIGQLADGNDGRGYVAEAHGRFGVAPSASDLAWLAARLAATGRWLALVKEEGDDVSPQTMLLMTAFAPAEFVFEGEADFG